MRIGVSQRRRAHRIARHPERGRQRAQIGAARRITDQPVIRLGHHRRRQRHTLGINDAVDIVAVSHRVIAAVAVIHRHTRRGHGFARSRIGVGERECAAAQAVGAVQLRAARGINDGGSQCRSRAIVSFSHRTGSQHQRGSCDVRRRGASRGHTVIPRIRPAQRHPAHVNCFTCPRVYVGERRRIADRQTIAAHHIACRRSYRCCKCAVIHFINTSKRHRQRQRRDRAIAGGIAAAGQAGTQVIVIRIAARQSQITKHIG